MAPGKKDPMSMCFGCCFSRENFGRPCRLCLHCFTPNSNRAALEEMAGFFLFVCHGVQSFDESCEYRPIFVVKEGGKVYSLTSLTQR
jgi:flavoprotein